MAADYSIQVLGGLSIADGEKEIIELSSRKAEAIVVYSLFSGKPSIEREEMATLFWAEMSESNAMRNLRVTLSTLKKKCEDLLVISRRRVSLNPGINIESDYRTLNQALTDALTGQPDKRELSDTQANVLYKNLPLYRGDFLQGFFIKNAITFDDWAAYEREALRRNLIDASQMLIHTFKKKGQLKEAIDVASRLLIIDPFNDAAYNWLIELYALNGQRDQSLIAFEDYQNMLQKEIGVDPSDETIELVASIRSGALAPDTPASAAIEQSSLPIPNNIPMELSPFFGRKSELVKLRDYLHNPHLRLVTMVGQGGTGKTRLAIEAAKKNMRLFPDGVWFVKLESIVSADLVLPEIYKVLGIAYPQRDEAEEQLITFLNGHHVLVVLDNLEHLLDASPIISNIIQRTENSKVIVTSREITGLPEETNMYLEGLESLSMHETGKGISADDLSAAGSMFLERAQRFHPDFDPKNEDFPLIEAICDLVAGLPLGIELAASGLKSNTLESLRDKIAADITFLQSDRPDLPDRQQSLMSVFNTFWEQLAEDEQQMLCRLSAFCGILTQNAAKKVAGVSIFFLSNLVARGFLKRAGSYGYRSHSMHRKFVRMKLQQDQEQFLDVSKKHRDYYFTLLERIVRPLRDSPQKVMLDELEMEMCNIQSALHFTIAQGEKQQALQFCEYLMPFWKIRGYYQEGYHWMDSVFALEGEANPVMEASALCAASKLVSVLGDQEKAEAYSRRSFKIASETGDQHGIARALNSLGAVLSEKGNPRKAGEIYGESLEIYRSLRVQQAIAGTLVNLAAMEIENDKLDEATSMLDEAMTSFELVGDTVGIVHVLLVYARIALIRENSKKAFVILKEALQKSWKLSAREELIRIYVLLAQSYGLIEKHEKSAQLLTLVKMTVMRHKLPLSLIEEKIVKDVTQQVKNALSEKTFKEIWRQGELIGESAIVETILSS